MSKAADMEGRILNSLLKRKKAYEKYFKTIEGMDNPAQTAYTGILKTILDISKKAGAEGADRIRLNEIAKEILENDYGIKING